LDEFIIGQRLNYYKSSVESNHAFLDDKVPKIEVLVLAVQLVIGNQGQMLPDLTPQMLPVTLDLPRAHEGPKYFLDCQCILVVSDWLFQGYRRLYLHCLT
jgi:hypothetical protein